MKNAIITILLVVAAQTVWAQQKDEADPTTGDIRVVNVNNSASDGMTPEMEELHNVVLSILRKELGLTDEQFEIFAPIYGEYRHNIRTGLVGKPKVSDPEAASDKEINALLTANLDNYIHVAMVRKVYIPIFEKVLTPKQVYKLYVIDNGLSKKAGEELNKRRKRN